MKIGTFVPYKNATNHTVQYKEQSRLMISKILLWTFIFMLLLAIQYIFAEYYLIMKKGCDRLGHRIYMLMQVCTAIVGSYLMVCDEHLYFYGLAFLLMTLFLAHGFQKRCDKRSKEKTEETTQKKQIKDTNAIFILVGEITRNKNQTLIRKKYEQ